MGTTFGLGVHRLSAPPDVTNKDPSAPTPVHDDASENH